MLALILTLLLQNAALRGVVVKSGTDEPLSKASIELRKAGAGSYPYTYVTADSGAFQFPNLPAGEYRVIATRTGYVPVDRGVSIKAGETPPVIEIAMTPAGAIYGRVYDERSEPIVNTTVQALKSTFEDGRRRFDVVQTALTNDLGEYRLFWLSPGSYHVSVLPPVNGDPNSPRNSLLNNPSGGRDPQAFIIRSGPSPVLAGPLNSESELMVYFPGTSREQSASLIEVRSGTNAGSVDIPFVRSMPRRVRGVVVDGGTGQAAGGAVLIMERYPRISGLGGSSLNADVNPDDGSFDIPRVAPGVYVLIARLGRADGLAGRALVDVGDSDLDNVSIVMNMGFDLTGRIVSDDRRINFAGLRVDLVPDESILERPVPSGAPAANGTFRLRGVPPANYHVRITGPGRVYAKSIRLGTADVLNNGLRLDRPPREQLEIVVGTNPGRISGVVSTGRAGPTAGATVVLMPDAEHRYRADLFQAAVTDDAGRFEMAAVAPGGYVAFAWESVEGGSWFDPEFMKTYEIQGIPLHIEEGMNLAVDLPAIPPRS